MVALEDAFQTHIDEGAFAGARDLGAAAHARRARRRERRRRRPSRSTSRPGTDRWPARAVRRVSLPTWILPLGARCSPGCASRGASTCATRRPGDLRRESSEPHGRAGDHGGAAARAGATASRRRWRRNSSRRTSFPAQYGRAAWFTNSLNYYLAALFFNAFPLPQREAGARQTLRYIGEVLERRLFGADLSRRASAPTTGEIDRVPPGHRHDRVAARACRSCRCGSTGSTRCCTTRWQMARPGRVRVAFGAPLHLTGDDYEALAQAGRGRGPGTLNPGGSHGLINAGGPDAAHRLLASASAALRAGTTVAIHGLRRRLAAASTSASVRQRPSSKRASSRQGQATSGCPAITRGTAGLRLGARPLGTSAPRARAVGAGALGARAARLVSCRGTLAVTRRAIRQLASVHLWHNVCLKKGLLAVEQGRSH